MERQQTPSRGWLILPLILIGMGALVLGMWGGLARMGWLPPARGLPLLATHGPLMVAGFLGTLISLERAVAVGERWGLLAPALTAMGAFGLLAGLGFSLSTSLIAAGGLVMLILLAASLRRHPSLHLGLMTAGAAAWLFGNLLWTLGTGLQRVLLWWLAFLILTIVAERVELGRVTSPSRLNRIVLLAGSLLLILGPLLSLAEAQRGFRLTSLGAVVLAIWSLIYDVARRTVRQPGLPRFVAVALLLGFWWLGVGGVIGLIYGGARLAFTYDATLHALLLGFVISMIFGHAPIIFPGLIGRPIRFRPRFYAHLALLHLSLTLRVVGDLALWAPGRRWGGMLNVAALLLFMANTGAEILPLKSQEKRSGS